ncbi:MAG: hypothetical protein KC635_27775, partial [Myxococcales bacterium]|nr:hypothetical protein [Myxococcales bacterium]
QGTNLHHALLLASRCFAQHPNAQPVLLVVTDGEPTAHLEPGGEAVFAYPPTSHALGLTVRELDAAAREWVGLAPGVTPRFDTAYEGSPEVRFYVGRGGERFATVHARGQAGCGDPSGSLGVVFRVEGAGRAARFVPLHAESWSPELEGLVDLDGDGRPEGLRASDDVPAIFELGPENSDIRQQLDLPDHSIYPCPC